MTRAQRIKRIAQLAETDKQVATQTLSASRRARDENALRLEEFQSYRHEYLQALREGGATLSAARVREIRRFIDQLELTINVLRRDLARCENALRGGPCEVGGRITALARTDGRCHS